MKDNKPRIHILLVDDHPLVRDALHRELSGQEDMEVVGEASDGEEAVRLAAELRPDIVVMDIVMPKLSGLEASKRIKKIAPNIAILILSAHDDDNYVLGLLEAGAAGYLLKSARGRDLVEAVRAIQAGESVLHPNIIAKLLKRAIAEPVEATPPKESSVLSEREMETLRFVALGLPNKQIAERMYLSTRTVKAHLSSIFTKLGVASRSEALVKAFQLGLVNLQGVGTGENPEG